MYGVDYEADYVEPRNRWRAGFRLILAIPWLIVGAVYMIAAMVVSLIAWIALLIVGRYPQGLYNFSAGFIRFLGRFNAFMTLQTDEWPPFGFGEEPGYPVRVQVAPPLERYSRLRVLFRFIVAIPAFVVGSLLGYIQQLAAAVSWLAIVFRGRQPAGVHNVLAMANAYNVRLNAFAWMLLREQNPPVSDQAPAAILPAGETTPAMTAGERIG